ncbi:MULTISPECIES: DMT family transporter [Asticcacaulis]|uniref:DMT family transporter n=1 Tax=Asticcacaulis TaxID=76890 RepID=UPI001AE8D6F0|nr:MULTISPECIES: DMT family transporter [Asticcacaulis]MBP2160370.1 drug/metabolite transporter (DMT)-like permease [Asticcacaulis solisilvae]MDR6801327.1 drug/metabolite transporter (DMT)-like permease [Asticcacaulis sp. BE141]
MPTQPPAHPADNSAALTLFVAMSGFMVLSVGDSLVKSLAGEWPASAVAALRYLVAAIGLGAFLGIRHGPSIFRIPRPGLQMARGAAIAAATLGSFFGVQLIPLADAVSIAFISPVITALISTLILKEPAHWTVWVSIALAFCGVLIVLRPGLSFDAARLFPLAAAFSLAILVILNRKAAGLAPPLVMQFYVTLTALPFLIPAAVIGHFSGLPALHVPVPTPHVLLIVALVAVIATTGHMLVFIGTTRLSASVVAPLTYVQLLTAGAIGWIFFDNPPTLSTWIGAAFIVGGGLVLFQHQRKRA